MDVAGFSCRKAFRKQGAIILLGERDEQDITCNRDLPWIGTHSSSHGAKLRNEHWWGRCLRDGREPALDAAVQRIVIAALIMRLMGLSRDAVA